MTGSGKTAAFGLPLLERLLHRNKRMAATYVLVLTPVRELAVQVRGERSGGVIHGWGADVGFALPQAAQQRILCCARLPHPSSPPPSPLRCPAPECAQTRMHTLALIPQVHSMIQKLGQFTDIQAALVVGGLSLQAQAATLRSHPEIVVATPVSEGWGVVRGGEG